jgi:Mn-dependent DtxR family transcriptional regulator
MELDQILTKRDLYDFEQRIISILKSDLNASKPSKYLRTKDVCEMLNISPATLQNLRNSGKITFKRLGGILIYEAAEIERRLKQPVSSTQ